MTLAQAHVLALITAGIRANGYPPTLTTLGETLGVSKQAVKDRVMQIHKKGLVERDARGGWWPVNKKEQDTDVVVHNIGSNRVDRGSEGSGEERVSDS